MTTDKLVDACKKVVNEGIVQNKQRSIVGLFSSFDEVALERLVGTLTYKQMVNPQSKDNFTF